MIILTHTNIHEHIIINTIYIYLCIFILFLYVWHVGNERTTHICYIRKRYNSDKNFVWRCIIFARNQYEYLFYFERFVHMIHMLFFVSNCHIYTPIIIEMNANRFVCNNTINIQYTQTFMNKSNRSELNQFNNIKYI